MRTAFAAAVILTATSLQAASISLIASNKLNILPGEEAGPLEVSVVSNDALSPASENMTGWQVAFEVRPDKGAAGVIEFVSAMLRDHYILSGINAGLQSAIQSTKLFAFDFNFPFSGGSHVPAEPIGLVDLNFAASSDAAGSFGVFAIGGNGGSEWSDNTTLAVLGRKTGGTPPIQPREFANLKGVDDVRLGTVSVLTVAVPEPDLLGVFLIGAFLLLMTVRTRR